VILAVAAGAPDSIPATFTPEVSVTVAYVLAAARRAGRAVDKRFRMDMAFVSGSQMQSTGFYWTEVVNPEAGYRIFPIYNYRWHSKMAMGPGIIHARLS